MGYCTPTTRRWPTSPARTSRCCRLLAEGRAVVGDRLPSAADAARLPYTAQVFSEALRLYPPPWLIPRTALRDDELPSGLRLRAGTMVFLSPYRTQRDERFFPE